MKDTERRLLRLERARRPGAAIRYAWPGEDVTPGSIVVETAADASRAYRAMIDEGEQGAMYRLPEVPVSPQAARAAYDRLHGWA